MVGCDRQMVVTLPYNNSVWWPYMRPDHTTVWGCMRAVSALLRRTDPYMCVRICTAGATLLCDMKRTDDARRVVQCAQWSKHSLRQHIEEYSMHNFHTVAECVPAKIHPACRRTCTTLEQKHTAVAYGEGTCCSTGVPQCGTPLYCKA